MEGIHLRGGMVARGGIRWSDRKEDYRTEVLGLMKAQKVKNAVIVPDGSKGGFVLKRTPAAPDDLKAEVVRQYTTLMRGLLDLTDNRVGGEVVPPAAASASSTTTTPTSSSPPTRARRRSPTPRTPSARSTASGWATRSPRGGSQGYDHKALGITARGAWESVKRHFRELGVDVMTEPFTVVGVGRHVGRRLRQRDAAVTVHQAGRGVRPPAHLRGPRSRPRRPLRRAPPAVRHAGLVVERLRPLADVGRAPTSSTARPRRS